MNFKIYQSFYNKNQEQFIDKNFEKLDNTENLKPELREYHIYKMCDDKIKKEKNNLTHWGVLSWCYKDKINISSEKIIETINNNPDYDLYFFNPFYLESLVFYNSWENGNHHHKEMISIVEQLFPILNLDTKYIYDPMNTNNMFYCCYFIANKNFWDGYFEIFDKYFDALKKIDSKIIELHNKTADYKKDSNLNYFPFIHERLIACYTSMKNLKVHATHNLHGINRSKLYIDHNNLKKESILEKNKTKLKKWIDERMFLYGTIDYTAYSLLERCSWK